MKRSAPAQPTQEDALPGLRSTARATWRPAHARIALLVCALLLTTAAACRLEAFDPGAQAPPEDATPDVALPDTADAQDTQDTQDTQDAPQDDADTTTDTAEDVEVDADKDTDDPHDAPPHVPAGCLLVAVSDYTQSGFLSTLDLGSGRVRTAVTTTWQDAELRVVGGIPWVLNRLGADNVQRLDAGTLTTVWQRSTGRRSNPWDVEAIDDDHLVVALYGEGTLRQLRQRPDAAGSVETGIELDLAAWDPVDGNPEPARLLRVGDQLLVLLQRLTRFVCDPSMNGGVLALDAQTLEPDTGVGDNGLLTFQRCSPVTWALLPGDRLAVGLSGGYRVRGQSADDGGIEVIDLARWESLGLVLTETDLGDRDVVRLATGEDGRLWALLADADFQNSVHRINETPDGWTVSPAYWTSEGAYALLEHDGLLLVGDSTPGQTGVLLFDASADAGEAPQAQHTVGGPPRGFAILPNACP